MINVNEYFGGAVKSLAYENNGKSTVGVIESGEYEFGTAAAETMHVIEGEMDVLLPNAVNWTTIKAGEKFEIQANASFKVKLMQPASYLCKYH